MAKMSGIKEKHLKADAKDFRKIKEESRDIAKEVKKLTSRDKKVKK